MLLSCHGGTSAWSRTPLSVSFQSCAASSLTPTTRGALRLTRSFMMRKDPVFLGSIRFFAVRQGYRKRQSSLPTNRRPPSKNDGTTPSSSSNPSETKVSNEIKGSSSISSTSKTSNLKDKWTLIWNRIISPVRFMPTEGSTPGTRARRPFSKEEFRALAQRLPFAVALVGFMLWEETSPIAWIQLNGPSMLPTMAADQSEIWAIAPTQSIWRRLFKPQYQVGDLIGFVPPGMEQNKAHISCKRIVGLPGDRVRRYGAYVHLYVPQDPVDWGILWPQWTESTDWAHDSRYRSDRRHDETITVPPDHVWVEADCPGMGLDSRQLGPIPMTAIRGRVVGRLWPLWRPKVDDPLYSKDIRQRPHPIPLDEDTLRLYNVHKLPPATTQDT